MKNLKKNLQSKNWIESMKKGAKEPESKGAKRSHVPFRLNFLFFVIFALFVALIAQLGYLQIVNGENITKQLKSSSVIKVQGSTPRGMIYDSTGKALVSNQANPAITFTRGNKMTADDLYTIANKLNELIDVPVDSNLRERDKKDYWLGNKKNLEEATERLSDEEKNLDTSEQYAKIVDKVTDKEIQFSKEQEKAATIFKRMNGAQALNTIFIKNRNVTDEELAIVSERTAELPGVSTGTDWTRKYEEKGSLKSIMGSVSTEEQGIEAEDLEEYLAKGYARNDRVGTSQLEKQYEEVLQGTKTQYEITLDHEGNISNQKEVFAGEKGSNLVLSINAEFQKKIDAILKKHFENLIDSGRAEYSPGIYAVAMNPNTGGVLAMSGFQHKTKSTELEEYALGTITHAFVPGSVVKAGTLTAGWDAGVLKGNEVLYDEPIRVQGSAVKGSIYNKDGSANQSLSAQKALEISSNAYMMKVAFRLLGMEYSSGVAMPYIDQPAQIKAFDELRTAFAQYGMGTETGVDLPNEASGIVTPLESLSTNGTGGLILDLSFGQYDTYTTIQLAQYASTVANGGKRIKPHLVSGIYDNDENGNLGELKKAIEPTVLNTVDISQSEMKIIQDGFYDAVHGTSGWTTATGLASAKMDVSAKTGTAETLIIDDGKEVNLINSNLVAYGPSENAQVSISIMIPQIKELSGDHTNVEIAKEIMDAYYDLYMK
ncbi:peptidoglycan D,D-transpeptidase FtsI family protein [Enterococcus massiliensis]|uniref:peptidoglycan D,D-transpeptidase FtsI family protein n=1 Tax=Enterococcus massiliensis TaxID=1640685 RepID=UPI00065DC992|nr:penicillin-binding protein 2 [Enterococcus massiliensis]